MGRELRRREEKKNKNKNKVINKEKELDTGIKGSTLIKLVLFTAIILLVLYYVVAVFITKEIEVSWGSDDTTETSNTVENRILAKNIFNQRESEYLVYFYDFDDEDENVTSSVEVSGKTIYRVDTNSALNSNYVTEETGNRNVTSINDLKVVSPTVIEIKDDKVVAYYEGRNEIMTSLK